MTRAIVQAGKLLDVDVLDHLILTRSRFVCLKERGLGFDARVSEPRKPYLFQPPFTLNEDDDLIYAYTRAQVLADGVLADVSPIAREAGFRFPTSITADLHARLTPNEREKTLGQSYDGRLGDVLFLAALSGRKVGFSDRAGFEVSLFEADRIEHTDARSPCGWWWDRATMGSR